MNLLHMRSWCDTNLFLKPSTVEHPHPMANCRKTSSVPDQYDWAIGEPIAKLSMREARGVPRAQQSRAGKTGQVQQHPSTSSGARGQGKKAYTKGTGGWAVVPTHGGAETTRGRQGQGLEEG